jgi:hypothetical protein
MALRSGLVRQPVPDPPTRYLVELAGGTDSTLAGVQALAQRVRRSAAEVAESGSHVRVRRVVFVPEDASRSMPSARRSLAQRSPSNASRDRWP